MRRKFTSFLLLIFIVASTTIAQESAIPSEYLSGEQKEVFVTLESGYFIPAKESFRKNYDQSLFVGTENIPVSLGVDIAIRVEPRGLVFLNLKRVNNTLASSKDFQLAVIPAIVGYRYQLIPPWRSLGTWSMVGGVGVGFYWAQFRAEYSVTQNDPTPLRTETETEDYFGFGGQVHAGLEKMLGPSMILGLTAAYDITYVGEAEKGKLGNIGGYFFSIKIGSQF